MSERDDLGSTLGGSPPPEQPPDPLPPLPGPPKPPPPLPPEPERFTPAERPPLPPWLRSSPEYGSAPEASPEPAETVPPPPPWLRSSPEDGGAPEGSPGPAEAVATAPPPAPTAPPPAAAAPPPAAPAPPTATPATVAPPPAFGDGMAAGVLLTLAGGSAATGGILALQQTDLFGFTVKAVICGGIAVALLAAAVALRLVRGSDQVRSLLAVLGIAFAAASLAFADDPLSPSDHDNLVKFSLVAGLVAVLGWFTSVAVPSAVGGFLAAVALPTAAGAGVWLAVASPTHVQVYVTALAVGLVLALLLPRISLLRPHARGLGWTLAGAAVAVALPAAELMTRGDATALAAGATASAGLLLLAQRHRNLPAALGSLVGFATLEATLITTYIGASGSGGPSTSRLLGLTIAGAALAILVAAGVLLGARGQRLSRWPLPVTAAELLLAASLVLAILALFTGPGEVRYNPPQLSSGSTATHVLLPAHVAMRAPAARQ